MAIEGKTITLFCLSTDNQSEGLRVIKDSYFKFPYFDHCILGGKKNEVCNNISILDFSYIKNARGYNEFIIKDLKKYITTDFVLIIQADGYILNPTAWSNIFLDYDYVGAPWHWFDGVCGNGGFSLRSRRFLEESSKIFFKYEWDDPKYVPHLYSTCPEDYFLCVKNRKDLESQGIKFAPGDIGQQFSFEYPMGIPNEGLHSSFGFHGKHNLEFLQKTPQYMTLLQNVYDKYKIYSDTGGGDKGTVHDYIGIYSDYIDKNNCKKLLEIGVHKGYSIKMWEEYLSESEIVGVDINLSQCEFSFDRAKLIECDAASEDLLNSIKGETFDVIIDDGSHRIEHQIKSFELLFPVLNKGGYYFIEDIIAGRNEELLLDYLNNFGANYKLFRPIEKTGRYDDIIIVVSK